MEGREPHGRRLRSARLRDRQSRLRRAAVSGQAVTAPGSSGARATDVHRLPVLERQCGGLRSGPNTIGLIQADHHLVADAGRRYIASSVNYEPARPVLVYPLVDGGALVAFVIAKQIRHVGGCGCWVAAYPAGDAPLWPDPFTYIPSTTRSLVWQSCLRNTHPRQVQSRWSDTS